MIEQHLDIATADGAMNSFVVHPEEGGPFPVVLFYMDAPGKREELHDMARRLAAVGYFVVLPNLYYRRTRDFWLKERTEPAMAQMFALMATLDRGDDRMRHRGHAALRRCAAAADASRIGAVGYCMSGPFVVWAAAAFPDRLPASRRSTARTWRPISPTRRTGWRPRPLRELLRLRRDRQVGATGRHREAASRAGSAPARRTASSGTPASSTASCSRCAPASTTGPRPSATGSGCSACSPARSAPAARARQKCAIRRR